jgi:hypothetical protein
MYDVGCMMCDVFSSSFGSLRDLPFKKLCCTVPPVIEDMIPGAYTIERNHTSYIIHHKSHITHGFNVNQAN